LPADVPRPCLVAILLLIMICAPAAFPQAPTARENIQFVIWHDDRDDPLLRPVHNLLWLYQQHQPTVRILLTVKPTAGAYQQLKRWARAEAEYAPDMTVVPAGWLDEMGHAFRPMDNLLSAQQQQLFYAAGLDMFRDEHHRRAVPWSVAARGLLINADLLAKADQPAPTSWEEVLQLSAQLADPPDLYGLGLPGTAGASELFVDILWALGGSLTGEADTTTLNTPLAVAALALYRDLSRHSQPEVLSWSQSGIEELFAQQRVAMIIANTWVAHNLARNSPDLRLLVCPLPRHEQAVGHLVGQGLAIFKNSRHMRSCEKFARMVCQDDCQERLMKLGGIAVMRSLAAKYHAHPINGAFVDQLESAQVLRSSHQLRLEEVLDVALYLALSGRATPAEALETAQ